MSGGGGGSGGSRVSRVVRRRQRGLGEGDLVRGGPFRVVAVVLVVVGVLTVVLLRVRVVLVGL